MRALPKLENLRDEAHQFVRENDLQEARAHEQGNQLAIWLRRQLELSPSYRVDPFNVLEKRLGVDVLLLAFDIPTLEAIAVWGPQHGPAVLLNKTADRVGNILKLKSPYHSGVLRVTAAHELCHLIIDSNHALSAVDVLGGRMPLRVEQRARAFAAEFLLPSNEAGEVWKSHGAPLDLETVGRVVSSLCKKHHVTESVASWQVQHGAPSSYYWELDRVMNQLYPRR